MSRLRSPVIRHRVFQLAADAALAALAFYLAFATRFIDGGIPDRYVAMLTASITLVALGKSVVFSLVGLHQKWWRYFNLGDTWSVVRACAIASAALIAIFVLAKPFANPLPRSVMIFDLVFTIGLIVTARSVVRFLLVERRARRTMRRSSGDVLVIGAGSGGQMVVRELRLNPELGNPIGFVDDDARKRGMRLLGLKVLGGTDELGEILDRLGPDEVVIAIPSAPGAVRGKVVGACRERSIRVRTLPTVFELLRGGVQLTRQLREVQVEDVLGREPVRIELDTVGTYLRGRTVLVTGAGGSIGAELCRQIARVGPSRLILLDHAEDNLFQIDRELTSEWHFAATEAVLADCKEGERMLEVMQRLRPDIVFHAAAYKHVPLMESNPLEAVRNNAIATRIVAETAAVAGAERFVLISTDKAVDPRTVMGASKAMAEWVVRAAAARHPRTRFVSVRFGNVLGSSGSVVPIFRGQIERGGPVTVTHAEMTRYFMTIPEAVQLVIQAADLGGAGDVFVLEMGEPVRIVDLARNMIRLAGYEPDVDIAIEFTGPRPGEQLHERLLARGEHAESTAAARIVRAVRDEPFDPAPVEEAMLELRELAAGGEEPGLAERVVAIIAGGAGIDLAERR